jgi:hypothetical protein
VRHKCVRDGPRDTWTVGAIHGEVCPQVLCTPATGTDAAGEGGGRWDRGGGCVMGGHAGQRRHGGIVDHTVAPLLSPPLRGHLPASAGLPTGRLLPQWTRPPRPHRHPGLGAPQSPPGPGHRETHGGLTAAQRCQSPPPPGPGGAHTCGHTRPRKKNHHVGNHVPVQGVLLSVQVGQAPSWLVERASPTRAQSHPHGLPTPLPKGWPGVGASDVPRHTATASS